MLLCVEVAAHAFADCLRHQSDVLSPFIGQISLQIPGVARDPFRAMSALAAGWQAASGFRLTLPSEIVGLSSPAALGVTASGV
jgi:hypothetical protein